jgi:DNA-binding XRE family transcriptional regulator
MKTHKWKDINRSKNDPERAARVEARVQAELIEMSLSELRRELGITQVELARSAEVAQSQISTLENRDDHLVSTLRRHVRALGGDLEVVAVVGEKRIKLVV